jgi:cytochrome c
MRMQKSPIGLSRLVMALALVVPAAHAADAAHGASVFDEECSDCHSVKPDKNKKGPTLFGVVGRPAGSIGAFNYSDAMKASGITWSPDRLSAYVSAPKKIVPGGKMKYDGLAGDQDRADLIAYLSTLR